MCFLFERIRYAVVRRYKNQIEELKLLNDYLTMRLEYAEIELHRQGIIMADLILKNSQYRGELGAIKERTRQ